MLDGLLQLSALTKSIPQPATVCASCITSQHQISVPHIYQAATTCS
jgi:hypothetical protein